MKKIIALHHWLGTFFSFLFLVWFLSGFVMMYHGFPSLTNAERIELNRSDGVNPENLLNPAVVFENDSVDEIHTLRLNNQLNRPVYHLTTGLGTIISRYADNGDQVIVSNIEAEQIAKNKTNITDEATVTCLTNLDQWIPRTKFLKHLPIYKVAFNNAENTNVYVSSKTGELINLNTRSERGWSWVGAIPHWIYFKDIRVHNTFWSLLVQLLAALGFIMVITGIITGVIRYKKKPKAKFKRFKNKWYNFHYYLGLLFGLFICTWIFSGFMSMTPFDWAPSTQLNQSENLKWKNHAFKLNDFTATSWDLFLNEQENSSFKEVEFNLFNGEVYVKYYNEGEIKVSGLNPTISSPDINVYKNKVISFNHSNLVTGSELINEYDNYYYDRNKEKTLPVIRIKTEANLAYYIDPNIHEVVFKCAPENKVNRWLYNGLHSLDFSFLTSNRPLWDILVIVLLIGGTIVSFTGVVLGIKFIRRKIKKQMKNWRPIKK